MSKIIKIGNHRLTHASIDEEIVETMMHDVAVDVLYCDPPWGDGMMKFFSTLNKKQTGVKKEPISFSSLMDRLFYFIEQYVNGYVALEVGKAWAEPLADRCEKFGLFQTDIVVSRYDGNRECFTIIGGTSSDHPTLNKVGDLSAITGAQVSREIVAALGEGRDNVFDPCCGMGYSAKAAVAAKMNFFGNEINAHRLQKTVDFLRYSEGSHARSQKEKAH